MAPKKCNCDKCFLHGIDAYLWSKGNEFVRCNHYGDCAICGSPDVELWREIPPIAAEFFKTDKICWKCSFWLMKAVRRYRLCWKESATVALKLAMTAFLAERLETIRLHGKWKSSPFHKRFTIEEIPTRVEEIVLRVKPKLKTEFIPGRLRFKF